MIKYILASHWLFYRNGMTSFFGAIIRCLSFHFIHKSLSVGSKDKALLSSQDLVIKYNNHIETDLDKNHRLKLSSFKSI